MKKNLFFLVFSFISFALAQNPEWVIYDEFNTGIPSIYINDVEIDNQGNIWVATSEFYYDYYMPNRGGGIAKFDGLKWTVYNTSNSDIPSNNVTAIAFDHYGNLWVGTDGSGLAKFDGTNWTVYNWSTSGSPSGYITDIFVDHSGKVWVGTSSNLAGQGGGIAVFDGPNFTVLNSSNSPLPNNEIYQISGNSTSIWIVTLGSVIRIVDTVWTNFNFDPFDGPMHIAVYDPIVWVTINELFDTYLFKFDGTNWNYSIIPNSPKVSSLLMDQQNNLWLTTNKGLYKFDGSNWIIYDKSNSGLPTNVLSKIKIDNAGNKWIGTWGSSSSQDFNYGGLVKFDGVNWTIYDIRNTGYPLYADVRALTIDKNGNKWLGTWCGGVTKFDNEIWTNYQKENSGLPGSCVNSIAIDDSGYVWIGTNGQGLAKFNGVNWTVFNSSNSGLTFDYIKAVAVDNSGNIWIGGYGYGFDGGLTKFDGINWLNYNPSNSGLPSTSITALKIDNQGNKWICFYQNGVVKFDGVNWTVYNTSNSGLPDDIVYALEIDNSGNVWIGTNYGLAKFDGVNWITYNTSNSGLPDNIVLSIALDSSGNKWIGTYYGGLAKFDGMNWTIFNSSNSALPSNYVRAIAIDNAGNKWIGYGKNDFTFGGLAVYREGGVILGVDKKDKPEILSNYILYQNYPNPFNPETNIEFSLPDKANVKLTVYDLLGRQIAVLLDKELQSGNYQVTFNGVNLPSGTYFYELRAGNFRQVKKMILMK